MLRSKPFEPTVVARPTEVVRVDKSTHHRKPFHLNWNVLLSWALTFACMSLSVSIAVSIFRGGASWPTIIGVWFVSFTMPRWFLWFNLGY